MIDKKDTIQRISSHYVGDNCAQVFVPYRDSITMFDRNDIVFHYRKGSSFYVNDYLNNLMRKTFPYSNIPTHYKKSGLFKHGVANQILKFNEPYITVADGNITESFVVKDNEEALLVNKILNQKRDIRILNREQLNSMFQTVENEKIYVMDLDGSIKDNGDRLLLSDQDLLRQCRDSFSSQLDDYINCQLIDTNSISYFSDAAISFFRNKIQNMTIEDLPKDLSVLPDNLLLVKINGTDINMNIVSAKFLKPNTYLVDKCEVPVNKYTLDEVKFLATKITDIREPKISLKLNPGVEKDDIEKAKQFIKQRSTNNSDTEH